MIIQINDGRKTYDIQNQDGEIVGRVCFDPTNINVITKTDEFLENIKRILNEVSNISKSDGIGAISEKEMLLRETINDFFDSDVVTPFSNIRGLLSPAGPGKFFAETVLESLFNIVNEEYEKSKRDNEYMNEYLAEYVDGDKE